MITINNSLKCTQWSEKHIVWTPVIVRHLLWRPVCRPLLRRCVLEVPSSNSLQTLHVGVHQGLSAVFPGTEQNNLLCKMYLRICQEMLSLCSRPVTLWPCLPSSISLCPYWRRTWQNYCIAPVWITWKDALLLHDTVTLKTHVLRSSALKWQTVDQ